MVGVSDEAYVEEGPEPGVVIVFIVLNVIENVIHYNIGKYHEGNTINGDKVANGSANVAGIHFTNPSQTDWVRIIVIMLIFAVLQGFFTSYFSVC